MDSNSILKRFTTPHASNPAQRIVLCGSDISQLDVLELMHPAVSVVGFDHRYNYGSATARNVDAAMARVILECFEDGSDICEAAREAAEKSVTGFVEFMQQHIEHFEVLYLYEHSTTIMSRGRTCGWDSRPVAFAYIAPDLLAGSPELSGVPEGCEKSVFDSDIDFFCAYGSGELVDLFVAEEGESFHEGTFISEEDAIRVATEEFGELAEITEPIRTRCECCNGSGWIEK